MKNAMAMSKGHSNRWRAQRLGSLIVRYACVLLLTVAAWGGAFTPNAMADSINSGSDVGVGSNKAGEIVLDRAARELDRSVGEGTSDFVEGAVEGSVGKVKSGIGEAKSNLDDSLDGQLSGAGDRVEGTADQLEGKAKRNIGRLEGKASDVGDDVEESAEGIIDAVKDFFN